ncbi:MAG: hypothetical protein FJ279_16340 [Planctomycetes bacterium]|nr:hypothetical protein [Planctomycetota bacterium]
MRYHPGNGKRFAVANCATLPVTQDVKAKIVGASFGVIAGARQPGRLLYSTVTRDAAPFKSEDCGLRMQDCVERLA